MKAVEIRPEPDCRLWIRFADGTEGRIDLSFLKGRGVFEIWNTPGVFEKATIGSGGEVAWGEAVDLCADALYIRLTGHEPSDFSPAVRAGIVHA